MKRCFYIFAGILLIAMLACAQGCSNAGPGEGFNNCSSPNDSSRNIQIAASLSNAVEMDDFLVVEPALQYNPGLVNEKCPDGRTALHFAVSRQMVEYLVSKGATVDAIALNGDTPLHSAALRGNTVTGSALLHHGAPVNAKNAAGQTPLHYAAENGSCDMVVLLVSQGGDVNCRDTAGRTPLEVARGQGNDGAAELLQNPGGK